MLPTLAQLRSLPCCCIVVVLQYRNARKSARLDENADVDEIIRTLHLLARTDGTWQALRDLFNRPWPTRIWIVQESMLNNKHIMACGKIVFPDWDLLPQLATRLLDRTVSPTLSELATGLNDSPAITYLIAVQTVLHLRSSRQFDYI